MVADEPTVDRIISETLNRHGGEGSQDPDVWEAQNELYDKRMYDPALAGSEDYVIAERYMLARAMVATGQVPVEQMLEHIEISAGQKQGAWLLRLSAAYADAGTPSLAVRKLVQGAWDGEAQRVRNGRPKPAFNPKALAIDGGFDFNLKPRATAAPSGGWTKSRRDTAT